MNQQDVASHKSRCGYLSYTTWWHHDVISMMKSDLCFIWGEPTDWAPHLYRCTFISLLADNHFQPIRSQYTTTLNQWEASIQPLTTKPYLQHCQAWLTGTCLQIIASQPIRSLYCQTSTAIGWIPCLIFYLNWTDTGHWTLDRTHTQTDTTTSKPAFRRQ